MIQYKALQMTIASTYATGAMLLERCDGFLQRLVTNKVARKQFQISAFDYDN